MTDILECRPLIHSCLQSLGFNTSNNLYEDLVQQGWEGVLAAQKKYDKLSTHKFASYAYLYIKGYVLNYLKHKENKHLFSRVCCEEWIQLDEGIQTRHPEDEVLLQRCFDFLSNYPKQSHVKCFICFYIDNSKNKDTILREDNITYQGLKLRAATVRASLLKHIKTL